MGRLRLGLLGRSGNRFRPDPASYHGYMEFLESTGKRGRISEGPTTALFLAWIQFFTPDAHPFCLTVSGPRRMMIASACVRFS